MTDIVDPVPEAPAAPVAAPAAPVVAPVAAPAAPAAPVVAAPAAVKPPTMLDAITQNLEKKHPASTAPRDPVGRFVPKVGADGKPLPGQPAAGSPVEAKPDEPEDITVMPDGLSQKGQQRFQQLANANKQLVGEKDMLDRQVSYVRDTFAQHGVQKEQFEQAAGVIGMINRGDFEGAQKILQQQLQQLAVMSGKPLAQVDALEAFPDLRAEVEAMQITEARALEIARARMNESRQHQTQQRDQQTQQAQDQERQVVETGTKAVDAFCKRMLQTDIDYAAIEAHLLPEIPNLLRGVPPAQWAGTVEAQYRLIKKVAGTRQQTTTPAPLRPTGHGSLREAPKTMHEAMFGEPAPR